MFRCVFHPLLLNHDTHEEQEEEEKGKNLLVDLLQEGNLLLQRLDASLQVQAGQRGSVHILPQLWLVFHCDRK